MGRCPHAIMNYVCKIGSEFKEFSHTSDELASLFSDCGYYADSSEDFWEFPSDSFRGTLEEFRQTDESFFNSYGLHKEPVMRLMEKMIEEDQTGDGFIRLYWF